MNSLLGLPFEVLAPPLLAAALLALVLVLILAARAPHLARISLRNVARGRVRTGLILVGLMLATTFVATALVIDQTVFRAVETVAVFDVGRVDEVVTTGGPTASAPSAPADPDPLGLFPAALGDALQTALVNTPQVAGVMPGLEVDNTLLVDATSHQLRAGITTVAFSSADAGPLADLRSADGRGVRSVGTSQALDSGRAPIEALGDQEIYLNRAAGTLLHATPGDVVLLYSVRWPQRRYELAVRDIVTGGPLGAGPAVLLALPTLRAMLGSSLGSPSAGSTQQAADTINRVYIANSGDGLSGVVHSDAIAARATAALPTGFQVHQVKQNGVRFALQTQDTFSRILALFTLFALSINLLLVFLLFALLAAERRTEIGVARAIGMRRGAVLRLLLFEGATYTGAAALPGVLAGLGLSVLLIALVRPTITQFGLPLQIEIEPQTLVIAFSLGVLFTLLTILLAAWVVSGLTVAAALRGLPEPPRDALPLSRLLGAALRLRRTRGATDEALLYAWARALWRLMTMGVLPLLAALLLLGAGIAAHDSLRFALGVGCALLALALLARAAVVACAAALLRLRGGASRTRTLVPLARAGLAANRASALVVCAGMLVYWLFAIDPARVAGLRRFGGGIEIFFVAGMMLVLSATAALTYNFSLFLRPLRWLSRRIGRLRHVTYLALVQPAAQRVRTGIALAMLALICFTMVVMAVLSASLAERFGDLQAEAGGYSIVGRPLFAPVGGVDEVRATLQASAPREARAISALSAARPLPIGILQPGGENAGWRLYPVAQMSGAFLQGVGLPLVARAPGYASDADVWRSVREQPGNVVIDVGALAGDDADALGLPLPPRPDIRQFVAPPIASGLLGPSSLEAVVSDAATQHALQGMPADARELLAHPERAGPYTLQLQGIVTGPKSIAPMPLWIADFRGGPPRKVTVIGLVDNAQGQRYGLLGSPETFAPLEQDLPAFGTDYYFFKLASDHGVDAHDVARALGAALLDAGFETTVIEDGLLTLNAPYVFTSRVLLGLVAITLVVAVVALMVTGLRNVVERRQQIGMLRALGFHRRHVLLLFLVESALVSALGVGLGLGLALLLCRSVFAVGFFDRFQSGLALVVPWPALAGICGAALGISLLAALLPAGQANAVAPAEALRYE